MTSDVCLYVAYIGPKSRTEKPRKTKIGTYVGHVTRDSDTTFNVKRSKVTMPLYSPRRLRIRQLQRSPWERIHRGNLPLRCRLQARRSARQHEALRCQQREERAGAYRGGRPPTVCYTHFQFKNFSKYYRKERNYRLIHML